MIYIILILSLLLVWAGIKYFKSVQAKKKAIEAQRAKVQHEIKHNALGYASNVKKEGKILSDLTKKIKHESF